MLRMELSGINQLCTFILLTHFDFKKANNIIHFQFFDIEFGQYGPKWPLSTIWVTCCALLVARCCVAWGKFRKLLPALTSRQFSPKVHGKVYTACVCSAILHGSETWGPYTLNLKQLHRNDCAKSTQQTHHSSPWWWDMGCLLWIQTLIHVLHQ